MEYYAVLEEKELEMALLLKNRTELRDVCSVEEDFQPEGDVIDSMIEKDILRFPKEEQDTPDVIRKGDSGTLMWNPFVSFLLNGVFACKACFLQKGSDGSLSNLYFLGNNVVYLEHEKEGAPYVFYHVPFVPKFMGALASFYSRFEDIVPKDMERFTIDSENTESDLLDVVGNDSRITAFDSYITTWGSFDNELNFEGIVLIGKNLFTFCQRSNEGKIVCESMTADDFLVKISKWLISVHG